MAVRIIVILALIAGFGTAGYLGFQHYKLLDEYAELQEDIARAENKTLQFQERYRQQKAVEANLTRTKLTLEGRIRALEQENVELESKRAELAAANEALRNRMSTKIKDTIAKLESEKDALKAKLQKSREETRAAEEKHQICLAEREKTVNAMQAGIDSLTANLDNEKALHASCREDNAKLSEIGLDVLDAYFNKGPLDSVLQAEPLIQSKQIQLEKIVQKYKDKIDEHTLLEQQSTMN